MDIPAPIPRLQDFRALREALNVAQIDLAAATGIGQSSISRLEAGIMTPAYGSLIRVVTALRCIGFVREAGLEPDFTVVRRAVEVELESYGL